MDAIDKWQLGWRGVERGLLFFSVNLIVAFWARYLFIVEGYPMHCLAMSLVSTHWMLVATRDSVTTKNASSHFQMICRAKQLLVDNLCLVVLFYFLTFNNIINYLNKNKFWKNKLRV